MALSEGTLHGQLSLHARVYRCGNCLIPPMSYVLDRCVASARVPRYGYGDTDPAITCTTLRRGDLGSRVSMCKSFQAYGNWPGARMASMAFGRCLSHGLFQSTVMSSVKHCGSTRHAVCVRHVYGTKKRHATQSAAYFCVESRRCKTATVDR